MPTFTTVPIQSGENLGIEVPEEVVASFDAGRRVPVIVTIGGHTYESTIAVMGGRYLVPLAKEHREPAGVAAGDTIEVTLEHDTRVREYPVPDDLAEALAAAGVRAAFDALAPSRRKEHVRQVESAKAAETRARRVAKIVDALQ